MRLRCYSLTILDLCRLYKNGVLELNPPYQRRPAWTTNQRRDLIGSIFNGIPVPAVIFYKAPGLRKGSYRLEVMDGKQRIETILHFRYGKVIRDEPKLGFLLRRDESKRRVWLYFKDLAESTTRDLHKVSVRKFLGYHLPVIEYSGELVGLAGQRIAEKEIFAKINSTGSKLTANEIRHAQSTKFFETGNRLESKWQRCFTDTWRVFSKAEVSRFQYHEFLLELTTIVLNGGISDKRKVLEKFMRTDWPTADLKKAERDVSKILVWMRKILKDDNFLTTRFCKKADFYTLFGILADLGLRKRSVMMDSALNRRARKALISFSQEANKVDPHVKKYLTPSLSAKDRGFARYIVATREGTDQIRNREVRDEVLRTILEPIFGKRRATRRTFDLGVKQNLWHEARPYAGKIWCPNPNNNPRCHRRISFAEAQVDHRVAHARGGRTDLSNAQLLCPSCNRSKGAR